MPSASSGSKSPTSRASSRATSDVLSASRWRFKLHGNAGPTSQSELLRSRTIIHRKLQESRRTDQGHRLAAGHGLVEFCRRSERRSVGANLVRACTPGQMFSAKVRDGVPEPVHVNDFAAPAVVCARGRGPVEFVEAALRRSEVLDEYAGYERGGHGREHIASVKGPADFGEG